MNKAEIIKEIEVVISNLEVAIQSNRMDYVRNQKLRLAALSERVKKM